MTPSEHSSHPTARSGYPNTTKAQENDLKSIVRKMIEAFKEKMNKSIKEIQGNILKQVEVFEEETKPSRK